MTSRAEVAEAARERFEGMPELRSEAFTLNPGNVRPRTSRLGFSGGLQSVLSLMSCSTG